MKTEQIAIDSVSPDPANARLHGERNLAAIKDSLRAFGQQKPIVVDKRGVVIAGNGTLEAAKALGWKDIAIVRTDLEPSQATAFGIADNRTGELAEWDGEVLEKLMSGLDSDVKDMLAFDDGELTRLLGDDSKKGISANPNGMTRTESEYNADTVRSFIVYFDDADYTEVVDRLDGIMEEQCLESHSEAMMWLIRSKFEDETDPNSDKAD